MRSLIENVYQKPRTEIPEIHLSRVLALPQDPSYKFRPLHMNSALAILLSLVQEIRLHTRPRPPAHRMMVTIPTCFHWMATKDASPTTAPNQLNPALPEKRTCIPNQTARFRTTPTTAAVMLDSADESFLLPLNFSI